MTEVKRMELTKSKEEAMLVAEGLNMDYKDELELIDIQPFIHIMKQVRPFIFGVNTATLIIVILNAFTLHSIWISFSSVVLMGFIMLPIATADLIISKLRIIHLKKVLKFLKEWKGGEQNGSQTDRSEVGNTSTKPETTQG